MILDILSIVAASFVIALNIKDRNFVLLTGWFTVIICNINIILLKSRK